MTGMAGFSKAFCRVESSGSFSGTKSVWYYELTNDGFELKQTRKPIDGNQLPDFLTKWNSRAVSENSWSLSSPIRCATVMPGPGRKLARTR